MTTDKYGRDLAYVETLPGPLDAAFNIPGIGKWIPGADQNRKMIDLGFGQPRYLELSGGHERQKEYDKAVERAKRAGVGVWSPEGLQQLDYHYQTPAERRGQTNDPPANPYADVGNLLGSGLMVTGQSGALREMGPAGNAIAQAWNAGLAGIGVADYNARAGGGILTTSCSDRRRLEDGLREAGGRRYTTASNTRTLIAVRLLHIHFQFLAS